MRETQSKDGRQRRRVRYFTDIDKIQGIPEKDRETLRQVSERYTFRANDYYVNLIDWNDPNDPIRRLVIPAEGELNDGWNWDASNEQSVTVTQGVQHKYGTTVLLLVNEVCDAFCRYCFRKRLFTNENEETSKDISAGLDYIREHTEVDNVLLTGGDPMILSTRKLEKIIAALREIDHVKIIRIGTKTPAFNPYRFIDDDALIDLISHYSTPDRRIYFMCHFDHPRELTDVALEGLDRLQKAGAICVNQNPIIRGISDEPEVMSTLWNKLSYIGVPQYYVFQGRPTAGNSEYEVPIVEAYSKIEEAKKSCSGLAKRTRFAMSHESGKIEILGVDDEHIFLKYHRAKFPLDEQRFLVCERDDNAYWLDQLKPLPGYRNDYYRPEEHVQMPHAAVNFVD